MAIATCANRDFGHFRAFCTKMQVALATCSMSKTVQKAPGADGLRRLWTWAKQCKKHLEQMAYAACGHGQTVQKAPGVDSKRRLWPCDRSGGAKGFGPLQATCPAPLATRGGLEHVRHLGLGRWQQVASAPSKPPAPPPSPHEEGWSTCATWAWAGGSRWLRPLQATCPAPLATLVGLEHVHHLGPMGGQVAPGGFGPSKPPACPPSPHLEGRSTCAT